MSYWIDDPQLFLYAKGTDPDDVILRRCKKPVSSSSSSLVVPMKSDDFDYASNVKNYRLLIGDRFDWDETDYKRLIKYIYERLLLVNGQGLVIAEIYKLGDAKEVPIYIRSLDVLPLKPYIPHLREQPIPLRTVKYLEDVNGKAAAMMEEKDSNVNTKLIARVENLEAENIRLQSMNNTLDKSVTQLTASLATITGNVVDLRSKNKTLEAENKTMDSDVNTLEGKVTKLTADLVAQINALTTLPQEVKNINANYTKEIWMNDHTNSDWVGIEGLQNAGSVNVIIVGQLGTFTVDENSTNVRARYWCKIRNTLSVEFSAVCLEDLTPNKERARFLQSSWNSFNSNGKAYACRI